MYAIEDTHIIGRTQFTEATQAIQATHAIVVMLAKETIHFIKDIHVTEAT